MDRINRIFGTPQRLRQLRLMVSALLSVIVLSGCAIGNVYNYSDMTVSLPVAGSGEVGLAVVDQRPYILNGKKTPEFVGLRRGGYGNPFNVDTASGEPLVEEMRIALTRAATNAGFQITNLGTSTSGKLEETVISGSAASRNIVLYVREWKSDVYSNLKVIYDLRLEILGNDGVLVAANEITGQEAPGGGAMQGQHQVAVSSAFENRITELFNGAEIRSALNASSSG